MKPRFESKNGEDFLIVRFGTDKDSPSVKLFGKTDVHLEAYESWAKSEDVNIEEESASEIAERLLGPLDVAPNGGG